MKDKLLAIWAKAQPLLQKLYAWSPLAVGIAIGYLGHPLIKLALEALKAILKKVL